MTSNNETLTFGRYLRTVRSNKGIPLEEVSRETKIGVETLLLIEREDLARLPAEVFIKGFLRAYAKTVGADADLAIKRYGDSLRAFHTAARFEADLIRSDRSFGHRFLAVMGLLCVIMVLSVWILSIGQRSPEIVTEPAEQQTAAEAAVASEPVAVEAPEAGPPAASEDEAPAVESVETPPADSPPEDPGGRPDRPEKAAEDTTVIAAETSQGTDEPAAAPPEAAPAAAKWLLKIQTVEDTWLKIIVDNQSAQEFSLHPGDHLAFEGSKGYNLLIGNATGIKVTLNDRSLAVPGKSGQVVNLHLP